MWEGMAEELERFPQAEIVLELPSVVTFRRLKNCCVSTL
jgi:hypothetical protein